MTVAELIEKLEQLPQDAKILIYEDQFPEEATVVKLSDLGKDHGKWVYIQ